MTAYDIKVMLFTFVMAAIGSVTVTRLFDLESVIAGLAGVVFGYVGIAIGAILFE
jgi:membrane associated rhomboid family serine protease